MHLAQLTDKRTIVHCVLSATPACPPGEQQAARRLYVTAAAFK